MSLFDEMLDETEELTDEDREILAAEEAGTYEPQPEPQLSPSVIDEKEQLSRQLAEAQERYARADERRLAAEQTAAPARQEAQGPPTRLGQRPDADLDPIGADLWDANRRTELLEHRFEEQQRSAEQREFADWIERDASQFRAQHPDYQQATAHAYKFRVNHWMRLGLAEEQARALVDQEALASAKFARQSGKSAAAGFYELAKEVGYNGAAQPVAKGQPRSRQHQSAPARGGKPAQRRVTAHDINAMGESEFEAALRRNPKTVVKALEGLEFER